MTGVADEVYVGSGVAEIEVGPRMYLAENPRRHDVGRNEILRVVQQWDEQSGGCGDITIKSSCKRAAAVSSVTAVIPSVSAGAVLCAVVSLMAIPGRIVAGAVNGRVYPAIDCADTDVAAAAAAAAVAAIIDAAADTFLSPKVVASSTVIGAVVSVTATVATIAIAIAAAIAAAVTDAAGEISVTDTNAVAAAAAAAHTMSVSGGTIMGSEHHVQVLNFLLLRDVRGIITAPAVADADVVISSFCPWTVYHIHRHPSRTGK